MPLVKTKSPEQLIVDRLKDNGQMLTWLADKIGVTGGHLHSVLKGVGKVKRDLTDENLKKINAALGTNFKK